MLVSVIMPSYNQDKYISEAIESVLNQSFKKFELIIIDNKSTDKSREIIKKYQEKDERIKITFHKENEGISKSINDGIDMASGKYISFICTDDIWDEFKLEKQLKALDKDENLIVWTEGDYIDSENKSLGVKFTQMQDGAETKKKTGVIFEDLLYENFICFSSLIFKKENLGNIRFKRRLHYLFDYQIEVYLAKKYHFYFINEPLVKYRIHSANTLLSNNEILEQDLMFIYNYFLYEYSNDIPEKVKWLLCIKIIDLYFKRSKITKVMPYIYEAITCKPLNLLNWVYLTKYYSKKNKFININLISCNKVYFLIKRLLKYYILKRLISKFHGHLFFNELISRI